MIQFGVCLVLSAIFLAAGGIAANRASKRKTARGKLLTPLYTLMGAVFCSAFLLFFPIYRETFAGEQLCTVKAVLLSIHKTICLFLTSVDFAFITDQMTPAYGALSTAYSVYAAFLLVLAPVLTFGLVLSLFKNASAMVRLLAGYNRDLYLFSELNDKSLTLAKDLSAADKNRLMVFTDVFDQNQEARSALVEEARRSRAILLKQDVCTAACDFHSKKTELYFFLLSDDSGKNTAQALSLLNRYKNRENTHLYVQSTDLEGELLLSSAEKGKVKERRIDPNRSLINRFLYDSGNELFSSAKETADGRLISVVLVGLGRYGSNLLKTLSWFCQMDGYHLQITAFDQDPLAEETLRVQCPELLSDKYNGVRVPGEAEYSIVIQSGVTVGSQAFVDAIDALSDATWVFVALGDDTRNIETAANLRMLFARSHSHPRIKAVVYNTEKKSTLDGLKNFKGQRYDIDFIGDLESSWNENTILNSELERDARDRHLKWGAEEDFWNYEYNYRSSVASALHFRARSACGIPQEALAELEHKRWNAYMRSEGYRFGKVRDDLAKIHPDLVAYDTLDEAEKRKDTRIVTT